MNLVSSDIMTADAFTKLYSPFEHWKRIDYLIVESESLATIRSIVIDRYRKDKQPSSPTRLISDLTTSLTLPPTTIPTSQLRLLHHYTPFPFRSY